MGNEHSSKGISVSPLYGGKGGSEFTSLASSVVKCIIFHTNQYPSLELVYHDGSSQVFGSRGSGGDCYDFSCNNNDQQKQQQQKQTVRASSSSSSGGIISDEIETMHVSCGSFVDSITITMRNGCKISAGYSYSHAKQTVFDRKATPNLRVIGFYGRCGSWLDSIGVITAQVGSTAYEQAITIPKRYPSYMPMPKYGGNGGSLFVTGAHSPMKTVELFKNDYVNGIDLKYMDTSHVKYANPSGITTSGSVNISDDQIVTVAIEASKYVNNIIMVTRKGKIISTLSKNNSINNNMIKSIIEKKNTAYKMIQLYGGKYVAGFHGRCGAWMDSFGILVHDPARPVFKTPLVGFAGCGVAFQTKASEQIKLITLKKTKIGCPAIVLDYVDGTSEAIGDDHTYNDDDSEGELASYSSEDDEYFNQKKQDKKNNDNDIVSTKPDLIAAIEVTIDTGIRYKRIEQIILFLRNNHMIKMTSDSLQKANCTKLFVQNIALKRGSNLVGFYGKHGSDEIHCLGVNFEDHATLFVLNDNNSANAQFQNSVNGRSIAYHDTVIMYKSQ